MSEECQDNSHEYGEWMNNIEMFVSVITSVDAKVVSHMGISRSISAASRMIKSRGNMSMLLHGFAAKCNSKIYPEKLFMLTTPNTRMRDILIAHLPPNTVHVGEFNSDNTYDDAIGCVSPRIIRDMSPFHSKISMRDDKRNIVLLSQATHSWLFESMFTPETNHPSGYAPYVVICVHALLTFFDDKS